MKILHTADWHLGKYLGNLSRHEEQKAVLNEICDIADREMADAILIAGDIFDSPNPPTESIELFYKTLKRLSNNGLRAVVAIAGNHDAPSRIEAPDPLARECGIVLIGYPNTKVSCFELNTGLAVNISDNGFLNLKLPNQQTPLRLLLTPFTNETRLKKTLDKQHLEENIRQILSQNWHELSKKYLLTEGGVNILMAHLFVMRQGSTPPEEPENERAIYVGESSAIFSNSFPPTIQYVAMGHLHRQQIIEGGHCPIVYAGSPLSYSFAEENQEKYVMLLDAQPNQPIDYQRIKLTENRKVCRGCFECIDEALVWVQNHQKDIVQLTINSDEYLSSADVRRLNEAHPFIINIIPNVKNAQSRSYQNRIVDFEKNIYEVFQDFFKYQKNQAPNEALQTLFREVWTTEED